MMTSAARKKLLLKFHDTLFELYGNLECPLVHRTPHELMVATILSAQCTDIRVNMVTEKLFKVYPDVKAFAEADQADLEKIIKPAGLFRAKAANIIKASRKIVEEFNSQVPRTMKELVSLPGIGRKTANVILGNAFEVPGFPVDTHVTRVLNRLGAVSDKDPVKIEKQVIEVVPEKYWTNFSHLIITHGRRICSARKPECGKCAANKFCKYPSQTGK